MKILIAADMEGISGVVHWDHVDEKHKEYGRFRKLMTEDVNAAIRLFESSRMEDLDGRHVHRLVGALEHQEAGVLSR